MHTLLTTAIITFCVIHFVVGFSSGPPEDPACTNRTPSHTNNKPQTGECPYFINTNSWIPGVATDSE